jgi:hypothetical protein
MQSWVAWVQRPSSLIKVEGKEQALSRDSTLVWVKNVFIEANINNQYKRLSERNTEQKSHRK